MSAIFTKGVETGRGGGVGKKDKLFHNNHRKHSPSDSPGGLRRPSRGLSPQAGARLEGVDAPGRTQAGSYGRGLG